MSNAPFNPYQPPAPVEPKPSMNAAGSAGIQYMYIYNYIFENPNWMTNVMFAFICMIIPVVGPLLLMGYQFEIVESLYRYPGKIYPDFDFNKFSNYLVRGLWPFLVTLLCTFPAVIVIYVVMFIGFLLLAAVASAAGKDAQGIIMGLGSMAFVCLEMVFIVLLNMVIQPLALRAGLCQDFGKAFNLGWAFDFIKKNWLEMILLNLFCGITGSLLVMVGMLVFCIGAYAALAVLVLAQAGMQYQLYNLYLSRGGEPIPLKDPPPPTGAYAAS